LFYVGLFNIIEKNSTGFQKRADHKKDYLEKKRNEMNEDLLNQTDQKWMKSGDLIVDVSSFENGFRKEEKRYRQEIWEYIQYRESLVRWPLMNEKIKMGLCLNHG
jgi:uncharacterized protein YaaR (DUF327 family)